MKKALKILGIILGSLIALLLLFVVYINFSAPPTYEVNATEITVKLDSISIAKGNQMAQMTCYSCHMNNGKLEGKIMEDENSEIGMVWASNITQHKTAGIGNYTDGELVNLLRTGIKRDRQYAPP